MTTTPDPTFTLNLSESELRLLWLAMGTLAEANPDDSDVQALDARITDIVGDANLTPLLDYDTYDAILQAESAAGTLTCEATEESGVGQWAAGPYRLANGRTLTVAGDGTATITA